MFFYTSPPEAYISTIVLISFPGKFLNAHLLNTWEPKKKEGFSNCSFELILVGNHCCSETDPSDLCVEHKTKVATNPCKASLCKEMSSIRHQGEWLRGVTKKTCSSHHQIDVPARTIEKRKWNFWGRRRGMSEFHPVFINFISPTLNSVLMHRCFCVSTHLQCKTQTLWSAQDPWVFPCLQCKTQTLWSAQGPWIFPCPLMHRTVTSAPLCF